KTGKGRVDQSYKKNSSFFVVVGTAKDMKDEVEEVNATESHGLTPADEEVESKTSANCDDALLADTGEGFAEDINGHIELPGSFNNITRAGTGEKIQDGIIVHYAKLTMVLSLMHHQLSSCATAIPILCFFVDVLRISWCMF
ncbi:hypothetical protein ACJX0J_041057, partial [Zea mays]